MCCPEASKLKCQHSSEALVLIFQLWDNTFECPTNIHASCSVIVFFICRIVSPTFKYDELRLKMSHEGTARVRHLCVCVLFMYIYAYFPLLCRNRVHTFVVCFYTKWINEWISSSVLQGTWSWQTHTHKAHNIRDNRLHTCDVAE